MKVCQKCGLSFPSSTKIDGKYRVLNKRKFCLECSPFGKGNRHDLTNWDDKTKRCPTCNIIKPTEDFYVRKDGRPSGNCKKCVSHISRKRLRETKLKAIEYKGGKCYRCGYNKCITSLHFHHRNREEKEFLISSFGSSSFHKLKNELDKCDLVCANCHGEIEEEYNRGLIV